jgi:hypothetical protein
LSPVTDLTLSGATYETRADADPYFTKQVAELSPEAHDMAIRSSRGRGAQPITWLGMAGELQRDWARTERLGAVAQILFDHAGASGTVLAWELANEAQRA